MAFLALIASLFFVTSHAYVMNMNDIWAKFAVFSIYEIDFKMIIFGLKGSLDGFNRGLYDSNNFKMPENCFAFSD